MHGHGLGTCGHNLDVQNHVNAVYVRVANEVNVTLSLPRLSPDNLNISTCV
jgi:hypothetical protein